MIKLGPTVASALLASAASAQAQVGEEGPPPYRAHAYVQAHLGVSLVTTDEASIDFIDTDGAPFTADQRIDYDAGAGFGVLAGYQLTPSLAVEAEVTGRSNDFDGNVSEDGLTVTTVMANGVLTVAPTARIVPYVGVGIGYASSNIEEADGGLAYQAKAGLRVPFGPYGEQSVGVEATYLGTGEFEQDFVDEFGPGTLNVDYAAFSVMATYRYEFAAY